MFKARYLLLVLFCAVCVHTAGAQSTILNVPTTDTLEKKTVYVEADFFGHLTPYSKGGYQSYGIRMVYGLHKKVEVGANFFYTHNGGRVPYEFQANLKWKAYQNEKHGIAVSGGYPVRLGGLLVWPHPSPIARPVLSRPLSSPPGSSHRPHTYRSVLE